MASCLFVTETELVLKPEYGSNTMTIEPALNMDTVGRIVENALTEDLGGDPGRDVTTFATMPESQERTAHIVARAAGVVAGVDIIGEVLAQVCRRFDFPAPQVDVKCADGVSVVRGDVIAVVAGRTQAILIAERTILNLMCRMSGVATHTSKWTVELEGTGATVLDTRKTTPGLRELDKYAVRCGGGTNKRMGLYDVAMIKDNHKLAAGSLSAAFAAVSERFPDVDIQVEVETPAEAAESVTAGARFLLCDNMSPTVLREAVAAARGATSERVELEATGGLTLDVAREYGQTGVDYMSVGGLTHSSPILDIALDLCEVEK